MANQKSALYYSNDIKEKINQMFLCNLFEFQKIPKPASGSFKFARK